MSFRKRGEILNDRGVPQRNMAPRGFPQRDFPPRELPRRDTSGSPLVDSGQHKSGVLEPVGHAGIESRMQHLSIRPGRELNQLSTENSLNSSHPGIRPSPATSQPTTSTGSSDLDKLLGHMGLPLGYSLLIEEESTTDFNSVLGKLFASQGVIHNRVEGSNVFKDGNTHLIVLSPNTQFSKELPGTYKGSRKDIKKSKIQEEQSKLTVSNLIERKDAKQKKQQRSSELKIAWRYGLDADTKGKKNTNEDVNDTYPNFNHQFDITSRLVPAPTSAEISFISPLSPTASIISQIEMLMKKHQSKLIRILLPNLLHPGIYPPKMTRLIGIIPLLHGLRALIKRYSNRSVLLATISTALYHNQPLLMAQIEQLFDSVLTLEPFGQEMLQFLERAYKSQPNKIQHGLVHVAKLPVFSERGEMHVMRSEWAFKNGRKNFEIEEWGIPVDDEDEAAGSKNTTDLNLSEKREHTHQHTTDLDF